MSHSPPPKSASRMRTRASTGSKDSTSLVDVFMELSDDLLRMCQAKEPRRSKKVRKKRSSSKQPVSPANGPSSKLLSPRAAGALNQNGESMSSASAPVVVSHPSQDLGSLSSGAEKIYQTWLLYSHKGKDRVTVKLVAQMAHPELMCDASWIREVEGHLEELQRFSKLRVKVVNEKAYVFPIKVQQTRSTVLCRAIEGSGPPVVP
jgi:hypothetical protein